MTAELRLELPWVPVSAQHVGELIIRRGRDSVLSYDDGISLEVRLVDPSRYETAAALLAAAREQQKPGRLVLVAGAVPVRWRADLRKADVSFVDVAGVVDVSWPRLRVIARRFGQPVTRRRSAIPLQKGYSLVAQELLIAAAAGLRPAVGDLAHAAQVDLLTASRAISQLAEHGLVAKDRTDGHVVIDVVDTVQVAERLAAETAWPTDEALSGYLWGRNVWDVAARISRNAEGAGVSLAVTGRTGAAFLGVLGTASPSQVRCWANVRQDELPAAVEALGLEPVPEGDANVAISADPWRVGTHHRAEAAFDQWTASVAHPVRVWCDLHGEPRGVEFAAQLWGAVSRG